MLFFLRDIPPHYILFDVVCSSSSVIYHRITSCLTLCALLPQRYTTALHPVWCCVFFFLRDITPHYILFDVMCSSSSEIYHRITSCLVLCVFFPQRYTTALHTVWRCVFFFLRDIPPHYILFDVVCSSSSEIYHRITSCLALCVLLPQRYTAALHPV